MLLKSKKILLSILILLSIKTSFCAVEVPQSNVITNDGLDGIHLFLTENGFCASKDGHYWNIKSEHVDKELRGITKKQLPYLLGNKAKIEIDGKPAIMHRISTKSAKQIERITKDEDTTQLDRQASREVLEQLPGMNYIKITQYENGELGLKFIVSMNGGGLWGVVGGAWAGKFISSAIIHGTILIISTAVSCVATPAVGTLVGMSLETTLAAPIEATTTAVALAAGIAGGVATGPV